MKDNILILLVIALIFITFFSSSISYTGQAYRTAVLSKEAKFQPIGSVGNRVYPILLGERFPFHTSPGATGISFMNKPTDGRGDIDLDGDIDKNDLREVMKLYSYRKDIPNLGADRFRFGKEYQPGFFRYTESTRGYYNERADMDKDGYITLKDVYWVYYLVNPSLGIEYLYDNLILEASCTTPGRKICSNYPGDDKVYKRDKRISQSYIGTCRELLPDSGAVGLYAYEFEACPAGTECVPISTGVIDERGRRTAKRGAECKSKVPRQTPNLGG